MAYTYRDLIRLYSAEVSKGDSDRDLNPRERRLVHVMLNVASNDHAAVAPYPPSDAVRNETVRYLSDILWNGGNALVQAVSPASADAMSAATERAVTILRNL
jgi:hypothetical protein